MSLVLVPGRDATLAACIVRDLAGAGLEVRQVPSVHDMPGPAEAYLLVDGQGHFAQDSCRQLRDDEHTSAAPRIIISASPEEPTRLGAFFAGADDFVAFPYLVPEFVLRVRALLRRAAERAAPVPGLSPIRVDLSSRRAWVDGRELQLTHLEFELLWRLLEHDGEVLTRAHLVETVWRDTSPGARTIDNHVIRLRTKLGPSGELLQTVRGFGYLVGE